MPVDPKNRLNDLDSRQWLQFQKSWFVASDNLAVEFIRFFTKHRKPDGQSGVVGILVEQKEKFLHVIHSCHRQPLIIDSAPPAAADCVVIDWRQMQDSVSVYNEQGPARLRRIHAAAQALTHGGYLALLMRNGRDESTLLPVAWHFGLHVADLLKQKDEKIGCEPPAAPAEALGWQTDQRFFYCLIFQKDHEPPTTLPTFRPLQVFHQNSDAAQEARPRRPAWSVVKPPPREKAVLLHPAKFPETLVAQFIEDFSNPGDLVFDPMAGTGSALVAARRIGRRSAGIELNPSFIEIIRARLQQEDMFGARRAEDVLLCGDATDDRIYSQLPPIIDYVVTSPPYWDMLRMKGAETQKKRRGAGLLVFYSNHPHDLGNLSDYDSFLDMLLRAYRLVIARLKPGGFMTVIVKNVKKRGTIYPLAWHLALGLSPEMELRHEQMWCQDDLKLAPYGYRYAWVSNTFHHYCLHFRKPLTTNPGSGLVR
jgi:DNA modification methylase